MAFDNAYEALAEGAAGSDNASADEAHWAFGTGFDDPLSGMDTTVPAGVDADALADYCLMLGDDALIMSHRLQEWCTCAPELEDEVAIANVGLDLVGQARVLLTRAAKAAGSGNEDRFAFFRDAGEFRNVRLAETGGGHFGHLIARMLLFSTWRLALMSRLVSAADPVLAAIAGKAVKELTYHRDYAAHWAVRLGDGTELSHGRMQAGLDDTWPLVGELFTPHAVERAVGVDPSGLRAEFDGVVAQVLTAATLTLPAVDERPGLSGREGDHSEAMPALLDELQGVAREHPDATW